MSEIAIAVHNLAKIYKLYDSPLNRIKESLHPLRKKYHKDFYALNNVTFEIKKGESVGIIGKNGSGKSTLLKVITGVLTPSSGNVTVNGKISALLELGAGFNPELTGIENVYFNGSLMGYSKEDMDAKLEDILSFADIGSFAYQPVKVYSSGMFVRLAFAVAINVEPDILIVDEALAVGDALFQARCYDKIRAIKANGVTILYVTHAIQTFQNLCSYGVLLNDGNVVMIGEPKDVSLMYYRLLRDMASGHQEKYMQQMRGQFSPHGYSPVDSVSISSLEDNLIDVAVLEYDKQPEPFTDISRSKRTTNSTEQRFGSESAEIVEFRIFDHQGNETLALESGQEFSVNVTVDFYGKVKNPAVGVMIRSLQGQNLFGIHSFQNNIFFGEKKDGDRLSLALKSTMMLNPGNYLFCVGVADHTTFLDYVSLDSRNNAAEIHVYGSAFSYGLINNPGSIQVLNN